MFRLKVGPSVGLARPEPDFFQPDPSLALLPFIVPRNLFLDLYASRCVEKERSFLAFLSLPPMMCPIPPPPYRVSTYFFSCLLPGTVYRKVAHSTASCTAVQAPPMYIESVRSLHQPSPERSKTSQCYQPPSSSQRARAARCRFPSRSSPCPPRPCFPLNNYLALLSFPTFTFPPLRPAPAYSACWPCPPPPTPIVQSNKTHYNFEIKQKKLSP